MKAIAVLMASAIVLTGCASAVAGERKAPTLRESRAAWLSIANDAPTFAKYVRPMFPGAR